MDKRIVILGAGMSGLMAAQALRKQNFELLLLDKGSRPGGRMATRSFDGALFDYGAQFFTVRHEPFAAYQRAWQNRGLVRVWCHGFNGAQDGHPRYVAPLGMNSLPAQLAQGLAIQTGVKVSRIFPGGRGWILETDINESVEADALIVTCPAPQALALFDFPLAAADHEALTRIEYDRCLALMAVLEEAAQLPAPGALQCEGGEPISWIADNQRKGLSADVLGLTIHAGPRFSLEHWDTNAELVAAQLLPGYRANSWKLHRWKYAKPSRLHPERCLALETAAPLILAGDAFGEPRVEGAALSGLAAAELLRTRL